MMGVTEGESFFEYPLLVIYDYYQVPVKVETKKRAKPVTINNSII